MEDIARLQANLLAVVEPVAAPQYWAHLLAAGAAAAGNGQGGPADGRAGRSMGMRVFHGCTAGWGLVYIKPDGEVWPCPFVPISGGNVRQRAFGEIWRHSQIFRDLRDRHNLKGRCGSCRYQSVCGGCRGKAFAACGDPLAEDPTCFIECRGEMAQEERT
jgi:radical SAM protein with 4Fe4S-binding SPASM domain